MAAVFVDQKLGTKNVKFLILGSLPFTWTVIHNLGQYKERSLFYKVLLLQVVVLFLLARKDVMNYNYQRSGWLPDWVYPEFSQTIQLSHTLYRLQKLCCISNWQVVYFLPCLVLRKNAVWKMLSTVFFSGHTKRTCPHRWCEAIIERAGNLLILLSLMQCDWKCNLQGYSRYIWQCN